MSENNLFEQNLISPLADKVRPNLLSEYVGHEKIFGKNSFLFKMIEKDDLVSLILWGPPGSGKTTIANIIIKNTKHRHVYFSAIAEGVKDIKQASEEAKKELTYSGKKTILFFDEIHRLNKAQQDALLPPVEKGYFTLIGATTENPSFEINPALLSRCKVVKLERLKDADISKIISRAAEKEKFEIDLQAIDEISELAQGDARRALTLLEAAGKLGGKITIETINDTLPSQTLYFDKRNEEHHNTISAFIKSMRASDPDATIYYLAKMIEGGENPLFIARRLVIFASEDIGNADPRALQVAIAAMQAVDFVGMPEGRINLSQAAIYMAVAPKSKASYEAINMAIEEVKKNGNMPIPFHLINAKPKANFSEIEHSKDNFPVGVQNKRFYYPADSGLEITIKQKFKK